jgi:Niemann-Pick C1 protein
VLNTQNDFIVALRSAYQLADAVKANTGLDVFPYSVFYIFFEQYLYITEVAWLTISLAMAGTLYLLLAPCSYSWTY